MRQEKFLVSVIMPIYNVEKYLDKAVENLLGQSLEFEENIQVVFVNDGSPDDSETVCLKYKDLYPNNIVYIKKPNGGVSSARNEGIKHAEGKYVIFFDADDLWEKDAFKKIVNYFNKHYDNIDLCSCRLKYIGNFSDKEHPLDYKFKNGRKVVDLEKEPKYICTTIGNAAIKREALKGIVFDESIPYGEDAWFQIQIISPKMRIGIIDDAIFYYRKNIGGNNVSLDILDTEAWYFDVPKYYYLKLIDYAKKKYGYIPRFIQETIMFDLKWRNYNEKVVNHFTEEQKQESVSLIGEVLRYIDDEVILSSNRRSQFRKLYLLNVKYNKEIIYDAEFRNPRYYFNGNAVVSLTARTIVAVKSLEIKGNELILNGLFRGTATKREYRFYALDEDGKEYPIETERFESKDNKGFVGEIVVPAAWFYLSLPLKYGRKVSFYMDTEGAKVRLRPGFNETLGITAKNKNNYCVKDGYIIKVRKGIISFNKDTMTDRIKSEIRLSQEMIKKEGLIWEAERLKTLKLRHAVNDNKIKNRAAFISVRTDGELAGNIKDVYEQFKLSKEYYASSAISTVIDDEIKASRLAYSSRVVVTDDYLPLFRDTNKKNGQYYVQLWHAAGAFKKFGKYGVVFDPAVDAMYHRDYDLVITSSDSVSEIYADAFQIESSKVKALGIPRTDRYFDQSFINQRKEHIYNKYPFMKDKTVIIYAPTFREEKKARVYLPKIDYSRIDKALSDNQLFVICPHPLMEQDDNKWKFDKIKMVQDIATSDMMLIADLLITDYSSIIFDYSLLDKPMAFFCYDYDTYERDFYLDYNSELPGKILKTTEELTEYLQAGRFETDDKLAMFKEKYMSACDGRSTERVANAIAEYMK